MCKGRWPLVPARVGRRRPGMCTAAPKTRRKSFSVLGSDRSDGMVAPMRMQFALALALVACRGFPTSAEGHGSGVGPPGPAAVDPGVPPPGPDGNWCSVGTSRPGPYPVTVRYHNSGTTPVYLPDGCG